MKYEFYINNTKYNPISNISLSKQRLEDNILIVRSFIEGDSVFYGSDYNSLQIYTGQQIEGIIKEIGENGVSNEYPVMFSFDNEFNPETKFLNAKVIYYDKYSKILNGIENVYSLKKLQKIYLFNHFVTEGGIEIPYSQYEEIYTNSYLITDIIKFLVAKIDDTILFDNFSFTELTNVFTLALSKINPNKNETIFNHVSTLNYYHQGGMTEEDANLFANMGERENIEINLSDILEFLRNLSFYWFIDGNNYFRIKKDFDFSTKNINLTDYANVKNNIITFLPKANKTTLQQNEPEKCTNLFKSRHVTYNYLTDNSINRANIFGVDLLKGVDDVEYKYINNLKAKDLNVFAVSKVENATFAMNNRLTFINLTYKGSSAGDTIGENSFFNYGEIIKNFFTFNIQQLPNGFIVGEYTATEPDRYICSRLIYAEKNQVFKIKISKDLPTQHAWRFGYGSVGVPEVFIDFVAIGTPDEYEITIGDLRHNFIYFYFQMDGLFDPEGDKILCGITTDNSYAVNEQFEGEIAINTNYQLSFDWLSENNQINNMPFATGLDTVNDKILTFGVANNEKRSMIIQTNLLFSEIDENSKINIGNENWRLEKYTRNITNTTKKDENIIISKKHV